MAVKIDIKRGSTIRRDKNGDRYTRVAHISGVTGNVDQQLKNALDDASMPNYGDAHPADSTATLQSITVQEVGGGVYRAQMEYYDDPTTATTQATAAVRTTGSTALDETQTDINGERIYFKIATTVLGSGIVYESNPFVAEVERPRQSLEFSYTSTTYPHNDIKTYLGRVNNAVWNGYAAKSMLCSSINVNERGGNYDITYQFSHNENTWQFLAALTSTNLALPASVHPTDPTDGVDLYDAGKKFDVYPSADFSALGFDLGVDYAEISGTAVVYPRITEADIVSGGKTVIITLYGGETWVASGATFDAQRANIIAGFDANKSEAGGWDASKSTILPVTSVVRTSDTVVTITFVADATYAITEPETVSVSIPASALVTSSTAMIPATRSFTIVGS